MSKEDLKKIKERMGKLSEEVNTLRFRYHVMDDPAVTDEVYDALTHELVALEEKYPQFKSKNSPTGRVGGQALEKFEKVKHEARMLSLNDAFSEADLRAWDTRIRKILPDVKFNYFCEVKFDGLAISLRYEKGSLQIAATRGDGFEGENVTNNIVTIHSIPLEIKNPKAIEVRGEAIMAKATWERLNSEQEKEGRPKYANTRNAAAGSIRQLDPKITASRNLEYYPYDLVTDLGQKTHSDVHKLLKELGFKVSKLEKECNTLEEVLTFYNEIEKQREKLPFGIDGIVICVNDLSIYKRLGVVGKAPRGAVALKFSPEQAVTVVEDILVQVGRTGKLTPIANLKPVFVSGTTVSRATLHNQDEVDRKDIRIGDTVVIQRAGDVIPEVVEALIKLRTGKEKRFTLPKNCPVCKQPVEKRKVGKEDSADVFCVNSECSSKNLRYMEYFVTAFNIYTVGPKVLERFKDEGLISDVVDLFYLKIADIQSLERFGEKSAENIVQSIQNSKKISLPKFIYSLGINHVGEETAFDLAQRFGSIQKLMQASKEEINNVTNIGEVVAESAYSWFKSSRNQKFVTRLLDAGIQIVNVKVKTTPLSGKSVVVTGALNSLSREEAKEAVREAGGDWISSVSKNTDYVVVGDSPGSKAEKAEKLGVKILNEQEFLRLLGK